MTKPKPTSPAIRLDLDNFDLAHAERSRYVLNSPRSLESCARLGVKPVELLIKSLNELVAEQKDAPYEAVRVMHESYEKERMKLLQMCREERERIIQAAGDRWPGSNSSSKVSVLEAKLKDHSVQRQPIPYADLCLRGKSVSRSSCSASGGPGDPDRSTVCSYSVGELGHSPANETILQRLTKNIEKEMCVTVSERDRKIAALMLVKHQEERARLKLSQHEEDKREEARKQEEAQRLEAEKRRRKKLRRSMRRWQEELEARRRLREHQEKEKAGQLEQEFMLQEDRWMRLKEEVEVQRREKMELALKKAEERKRYQEKLLREKQELEEREREKGVEVAVEKGQRARRSKVVLEMKERRMLQEENHRDLLRHILLKRQVEQQVEQEKEQMRSTLERKLQHSYKKRAQAVEARLRELHERGAREEEQIQRAQLRAKIQSMQQLTHKQTLVQLSQRRMEKAALHASAQHRNRAQQTHQRNARRWLCHQRLRERLQREEEAARKVRESYVFMKDWKRERLRRQRQQIQEEAQSLARASFHMRERVRRQIHSRTFDRMALEAQLAASMSRMKL